MFDPDRWQHLKFDSLPPTPPKKKVKSAQKKQDEDIQWGGVKAKEAQEITMGVKLSPERFNLKPTEPPCLKVDHRGHAAEIAKMFHIKSTAQPATVEPAPATEPFHQAPANTSSPAAAVEHESNDDARQTYQAAEPAHERQIQQSSRQDTKAPAQGTPTANTFAPAAEAKDDARQTGQAAEPAHERQIEQKSTQDTKAPAQGTPTTKTFPPAAAVKQEAEDDARQKQVREKQERAGTIASQPSSVKSLSKIKRESQEKQPSTKHPQKTSQAANISTDELAIFFKDTADLDPKWQ